MSATEATTEFLIIDHNIIPDLYVTYIVDIWQGDKNDPATEITRYIGVWSWDALETEERGAFDPEFGKYQTRRYGSYTINPRPIVWESLETVKEADRDAVDAKHQYARLTTRTEGYSSYKHNPQVDMYETFLDAVDRLAAGEESPELWAAIDKWRNRMALEHEK